MVQASTNYYSILGIDQNASQTQVKTMYHKLAKKYHADTNSDDEQLKKWSHDMMASLNEAYTTIKDPSKRKVYDQQLKNGTYNNAEQYSEQTVYVDSAKQAKAILKEGVDHFPFNAPTAELEAECKKLTKKLIDKKVHKYLRGIPGEFPETYLMSAVENVVAEAIDRIQEKEIWRNILGYYNIVNFIIIIVCSFKFANGFWNGILQIIGFMILTIFNYIFYTWIARFIARGFRSNLLGWRGVIINGGIALFLIITMLIALFFPEAFT